MTPVKKKKEWQDRIHKKEKKNIKQSEWFQIDAKDSSQGKKKSQKRGKRESKS